MSTSEESLSMQQLAIASLTHIAERQEVWSRMAAKYGVQNPLPPWKSSLDGICDALDQSACRTGILNFAARRNEEDWLSATLYADLPYPENQLVSLAHSLIARGVINESELVQRLTTVRARLES
jgi:hypothetical protein